MDVGADLLAFECATWPPILAARVDDAMEDAVGSGWRSAFTKVSG